MAERTGPERVAEVRRWHVEENGWRDIGYHFVIDRDGKVYKGRNVDQSGAFEPKVNGRAIGVCLLGGHGSTPNDAFAQHYTPEQDEALRQLIDKLKRLYPAIDKVTGHNDYGPKACPGFRVDRWLAGAAPERAFSESKTAAGSGVATGAAAVVATMEVVQQTQEPAAQVAQIQAAPGPDWVKLALMGIVIVGAAYALWSRWRDWQAGRR